MTWFLLVKGSGIKVNTFDGKTYITGSYLDEFVLSKDEAGTFYLYCFSEYASESSSYLDYGDILKESRKLSSNEVKWLQSQDEVKKLIDDRNGYTVYALMEVQEDFYYENIYIYRHWVVSTPRGNYYELRLLSGDDGTLIHELK